jgi:hypothetical protein
MKRFLFAGLAALACAGCNTTHFVRTEVWREQRNGQPVTVTNRVEVLNRRAIWSTESYTASLGTNSASLTATKSSTDQQTIQILVSALIALATKSPTP